MEIDYIFVWFLHVITFVFGLDIALSLQLNIESWTLGISRKLNFCWISTKKMFSLKMLVSDLLLDFPLWDMLFFKRSWSTIDDCNQVRNHWPLNIEILWLVVLCRDRYSLYETFSGMLSWLTSLLLKDNWGIFVK